MHVQTDIFTQPEYYSAIKGSHLRTGATTWMNLRRVVLSEGSQTQKVALSVILFVRHSGKGKTIGTKIRLVVAKGWWWEEGLTAKEREGPF